MMRIPFKESGVLLACRELLAAERLFHIRLQSGEAFMERQGKRWRITLCPEGTPDILCLLDFLFLSDTNPVLWIETKSSRGRQTREQLYFERFALSRGETYLLIRDVDELRRWLIERGIIKKNAGFTG